MKHAHYRTLTFILLACMCMVYLPFKGKSQDTAAIQPIFDIFQYRSLGPNRGGRVTAVTGVARQPGTFLMGSTGGGVWKTTDYGLNWKNISDGYFTSPSIGAIAVDQKHPDIIYVGTGTDGLRSNLIEGDGIYKTQDGGDTWAHMGLKACGQIGAVEIHPSHPDTVFVAAIGKAFRPNRERGVFRTMDGGDTWEHVFFHSDTVGAVDLEFCPANPEIMYISLWRTERKPWTIISGGYQSGGIYKSLNGGDTWTRKTEGLPQGLIGKIDLAVSPDDPDRLYALVEAPEGAGGLYRSDDRGESFTLVSTKKAILDRPFYYCNIYANPQNADNVFALATRFWESGDGGKTWQRQRTPHGDNHDMWMHPDDTLTFVQANDGGANVTTNGGKTWSRQDNQPTAEIYQVEVDDQYPYWVYGGQQDNSTIAIPGLPPYDAPGGMNAYWLSVGGCETGPVVPKPGNHNIVYANCKGRFGVYDKKTGQEKQYYIGAANIYGHNPKDLKFRFQRVAPVHVSPHNPDVVYHASQYVHRTKDDGQTWQIISPDLTANAPGKQVISGSPITRDITGEEYYSTIYALRESPVKKGIIWSGANDGPVWVTKNNGRSWNEVTPSQIPEGGRVDCISASHHDREKAYIAVLRYQLGDPRPYILKTGDLGQTWELLTNGKNGIPANCPVRVVREDPVRAGLLFAGTECGVFVSLDDGQTWRAFQQNLPITPVTDIKVHRHDLIVSTMGRGFWIADEIQALREIPEDLQLTETQLFQPAETILYRHDGNSPGRVPHYPDPGTNIDFYIMDKPEKDVVIDILDVNGRTIRSFASARGTVQDEDQSPSMATGFRNRGSSPRPEARKGMQRIVWDLRHRGPWDRDPKKNGANGPLVAPGIYTLRLTVNQRSYYRTVVLKQNPNHPNKRLALKDLQEQEQFNLQIRDLRSNAKRLVAEVDSAIARIEKKAKENTTSATDEHTFTALRNLKYQLVTPEGRYMQPMLLDQLSYLASMLNRADQKPGKDAYERYEELKERFGSVSRAFETLMRSNQRS